MVKRYITLSVFLCLFCLSSIASANENQALSYYVGGKLGYTNYLPTSVKYPAFPSQQLDDSDTLAIGAMLGLSYKFIPQFGIRTELEYMYRIPTESKYRQESQYGLKMQNHTILANFYLDYYVQPALNLYIGGGVGIAIIDGKASLAEVNYTATKTRLAAQGGAGVAYTFQNNLILDLNVRYTHLGYFQVKELPAKVNISGVEALVSLGYKF